MELPKLPAQSQHPDPQPGHPPFPRSHQFDALPTTQALIHIPLGEVVHGPLVQVFLGR